MHTKRVTVTREQFIEAATLADKCFNERFPKTKFAWYCEQFLKLNEKTLKAHNKAAAKNTKDLNTELQKCRIDNAVEKDGKLVFNDKGGYCYDKKGEYAVISKQNEIAEKIETVVDEFLKETVEVVCITSPFEKLPEDLLGHEITTLNGFVFKNPNPHAEEITSEDPQN